MGKDKKDKKKDKDAPKTPAVHATAKFAVIDYPGQTQPDPSKLLKSAATSGAQGRRAKAGSGPKIDSASIGGDSFTVRTPNPEWLQHRVSVYDRVKEQRANELAQKVPVPITVTMPDGKVLEKDRDGAPFTSWTTTPYHVALTISQGLADASTVARVTYSDYCSDYSLAQDGMETADTLMDAMAEGGVDTQNDNNKVVLWDMTRPLVGNVAKLELLKFENDSDAKTVFWHSSAHMMGEALEHLFGSKLTIGPPLAGGFYYDSYMDALREDDCTLHLSILCIALIVFDLLCYKEYMGSI